MSIAVFVIIIIMATSTAITSGNSRGNYFYQTETGNTTTDGTRAPNYTNVNIISTERDKENQQRKHQGAVRFAKITQSLTTLNLLSNFERNCFKLTEIRKVSENKGKLLKVELVFTELDIVDHFEPFSKPTVDVQETYDVSNAYLLDYAQAGDNNFTISSSYDDQNKKCEHVLTNTYNVTLDVLPDGDLDETGNETFPESNETSNGNKDKEERLAAPHLTSTQIMVIAVCSSVIGLFFIAALTMRIRNYFRRLRREQELAERPSFRGYTVALKHEPKRHREHGSRSTRNKHGDAMNGEELRYHALGAHHAESDGNISPLPRDLSRQREHWPLDHAIPLRLSSPVLELHQPYTDLPVYVRDKDAATKKHDKGEKNSRKPSETLTTSNQQEKDETLCLKQKPLSTNSFTSCDIPISNSISGEFADYSSIMSTPFNQSFKSKASASYNNNEQQHNFTNGACGGYHGNGEAALGSARARSATDLTHLPPEVTLDYATSPEVTVPHSEKQSLTIEKPR
ncbi:uncharacterized protein LOC106171600 isoform X1 [Lingula anatina]|uniref:Uncharacterized protein LOC106171600 isoform X1 n=1 Tax=Lingula anatina TaxID=7574 RepID=A0A1S3JAQ6_LINAN|nr:uncharacterized protein LOC106171600 isoform X1 [Lingula anatina]XP_013407483.1 uncharacterized protein LOC106171600 isoform X1 [Lingula anatina]|eukprot:XP_013407482.1 uncharacterized protein LOC106171600 isoform X1 [Lingula anatina]